MSSSRICAAGVALIAAVLIVAGCGSSSSSTSSSAAAASGSSTSGGAGATSNTALIAKAKAYIAPYTKLPGNIVAGAKPYKPGHGTASVVACGFDVPPCVEAAQDAAAALHKMGWTTGPVLNGQDSPQAEAAIMERAVQQKQNGVVLVGVDVNTIPQATQAAVAAGVHISCVVCTSGAKWKGKVIDVTPDWTKAGELAAWYILSQEGDKAKIVQFYDSEFAAVTLRAQGVENVIKANCPSCSLSTLKVTISELVQPGPPPYTSLLTTHPKGDVTDTIAQADAFALSNSKTDASEGRNEIAMGGWDGDKANLVAMVTGKPRIDWSVAHPYDYEAWAAADVIGRLKAGAPLPAGLQEMPLTLVTKANAPQLLKGNPAPSTYPAPPGNWQGTFEKLWGQSS
jgi:ABC-type sugar transport system substrate-binding protein